MEKFPFREFGSRLKAARGRKTQAELAREVGVTQGQVAKYEKGMMPQADILERISVAVGVSSAQLLKGEDADRGHLPPLTPEGFTEEDLQILELLKKEPEKYLAAKDLIRLNNEEVFGLRVEINQKLKARDER